MYKSPGLEYVHAEFGPPEKVSLISRDQPPPFKVYRNAEQIHLPRPWELQSAISCKDTPTRTQISQLLLNTCGLTHQMYRLPLEQAEAPHVFISSLHRPVPSGGALFPWECYLFVGTGQQLPAGIYHYDVAHHGLDILRLGDYMEDLCAALACPPATCPPYALILSCFFWKDGFKYGVFSYRLQSCDIGTIIGQNMEVSQRCGLQPTVSFQFLDEQVNQLLDVNYLHESVYAVITLDLPQQRKGVPLAREARNESAAVPTAPLLHSIEEWPLLQAVHSASLYRSSEDFRPLSCLPALPVPPSLASHVLPPVKMLPDLLIAQYKRHSTWGRFSPVPIHEHQLAQLLLASSVRSCSDLDGEVVGPGHTHIYCAINRVEHVTPGIYFYDREHQTLALIVPGDMRAKLQRMLRFQTRSMYEVSLCVFLVGDYEAGFQAYGDRWHRMQNMEVGIVIQRLYLAAAALGLGSLASQGFLEGAVRSFLSLPAGQHVLIQVLIGPESPPHGMYQQPLLL